MSEKCSKCGGEARTVRGDYQFRESGLDNVVLRNIELVRCEHCGNEEPIIRGLDEVLRTIAFALVSKPYRLAGEEIRYLRKYTEMSSEQFARLLHIDRTTLSKWENNDDPVGAQSDLAIRMLVMALDDKLKSKLSGVVREQFEKIQFTLKKDKKHKFVPERPTIRVETPMHFSFG
jgi:YgiT-type zinc finger domain-containing protein